MSEFLIPVCHTALTLNEIPGRLAISFVIGNCKQHCKGCHSSYLWNAPNNWWTMDEIRETAEKYVEQSIKSVLNQTFTNFELIIIDDCSKDNSYRIINKKSQDEIINKMKGDVE